MIRICIMRIRPQPPNQNFYEALVIKNMYRQNVKSPIKQVFGEFSTRSTTFKQGHVTVIGKVGGQGSLCG